MTTKDEKAASKITEFLLNYLSANVYDIELMTFDEDGKPEITEEQIIKSIEGMRRLHTRFVNRITAGLYDALQSISRNSDFDVPIVANFTSIMVDCWSISTSFLALEDWCLEMCEEQGIEVYEYDWQRFVDLWSQALASSQKLYHAYPKHKTRFLKEKLDA